MKLGILTMTMIGADATAYDGLMGYVNAMVCCSDGDVVLVEGQVWCW